MPYSLIHCKTIRTGIHKGNPLVPFVESEDVVLLKTLFAKLSARTEGSETRSEGCPTALSPISVRTEIGCLRGTSAREFYYFKGEQRIATGQRTYCCTPYVFAITKRFVILSA